MATDFVRLGVISQKAPNVPPVALFLLQKPYYACHKGPDSTNLPFTKTYLIFALISPEIFVHDRRKLLKHMPFTLDS